MIEYSQVSAGVVGEYHEVGWCAYFDSGQSEVHPGVPRASGESGVTRQSEGVEETNLSCHDTVWIHAGIGACQDSDSELVRAADRFSM